MTLREDPKNSFLAVLSKYLPETALESFRVDELPIVKALGSFPSKDVVDQFTGRLESLLLELRYANDWDDLFSLALKTAARLGGLSLGSRSFYPGKGNYWEVVTYLDSIARLDDEKKAQLFLASLKGWNSFLSAVTSLFPEVSYSLGTDVISDIARDVDWKDAEAYFQARYQLAEPFMPEEEWLRALAKLQEKLPKHSLNMNWNNVCIGELVMKTDQGESQYKILLMPAFRRYRENGTVAHVIGVDPSVLQLIKEYEIRKLGVVLSKEQLAQGEIGGESFVSDVDYILVLAKAPHLEPIPISSKKKPLFGVSLELGTGELFSPLPYRTHDTFQSPSHGWCGGLALNEDGLVGIFGPQGLFPTTLNFIPVKEWKKRVKDLLEGLVQASGGKVELKNVPLLGIP